MVTLDPVTGDPGQLRRAYGCFPSGVTALCALDGTEPVGISASSFTCVSLDPGQVLVCVQNSSTTWPRLRRAPRLGVSVLAEHHGDQCRALSVKGGDRFARVEWSASEAGAVFVHDAVAWLECTTDAEVPAGDHTIVLLGVRALRVAPDRSPLVFHTGRFRRLLAV